MIEEDFCWIKKQLRTLLEYIGDRELGDDVMKWKRQRLSEGC